MCIRFEQINHCDIRAHCRTDCVVLHTQRKQRNWSTISASVRVLRWKKALRFPLQQLVDLQHSTHFWISNIVFLWIPATGQSVISFIFHHLSPTAVIFQKNVHSKTSFFSNANRTLSIDNKLLLWLTFYGRNKGFPINLKHFTVSFSFCQLCISVFCCNLFNWFLKKM